MPFSSLPFRLRTPDRRPIFDVSAFFAKCIAKEPDHVSLPFFPAVSSTTSKDLGLTTVSLAPVFAG